MGRPDWGLLSTWLWPIPALAAVFAAFWGSPTAWIVAFFSLVLLWPATLAARRIAGPAAGVIGGGICTTLLAALLVLPPPAIRTQPTSLVRRLSAPNEALRHTFRLPVTSRSWTALWSQSPQPVAYLYLWVNSHASAQDPGLVVRLGDQELGRLTLDTLAPPQRRIPRDLAWHRLPVSRQQLEATPLLHVTVALDPASRLEPGVAGLEGGYSFAPTYPPSPSSFFDGERWTTDPHVVLPGHPPGFDGPVRYYIELRIFEPGTGRALAIYY